MARSLSDPKQNSLGGTILTQEVTLTSSAQQVRDLLTLPTGYNASDILEVWIAGKDSVGTARGAILFGGADAQLGYAPSDTEVRFPIRGGAVWLKRAGGADVTAILVAILD